MANILDYLDWRGDISFKADEFNVIDNLILAELSYTYFDDIVPGVDSIESITLEDACEKFFAMHTDEEIMSSAMTVKIAPYVMKKMINTNRFGGMRLKRYINQISVSAEEQFSAITFELPDNTEFVAFRGTDNTIIGWKEDFNMSFWYQTPAQKMAAEYLTETGKLTNKPIRVGGHSKGGNLSVYGSAFCDEEVRSQIVAVYSNDGPGFMDSILETDEYKAVIKKTTSIVPESSVVGMLLGNDMEHSVVKSSNFGAYQHDALSWQVIGNHFETVEHTSESSQLLDKTLKIWLQDLDDDIRKEFVDALFEPMMESDKPTTIDDINSAKFKSINHYLKTYSSMPPEKQKILHDIILKLADSGRTTMQENVKNNINLALSDINDNVSSLNESIKAKLPKRTKTTEE